MSSSLRHSTQIVFIGITLFALFFGAGNLILPVMLGQLAGEHVWTASFGFVITGVMLPLLGVVALGLSGETDFLVIAKRAGRRFGLIFATALYLVIGPLLAMPRTGSVSYEIALQPFAPADYNRYWLAGFSVLYFAISCLLSINPNKIIDIVGKVLTPLMLFFIGLLVANAIVSPMGALQPAVTNDYAAYPFFTGFTNGYLTMDAMASFIFGMIVIYQITALGVTSRSHLLYACLKASAIAALLLAVIYISLSYLGATSVAETGILENGGQVLVASALYYFGPLGNVILGLIVLMACLTTNIGLTTACANYFHHLWPQISYRRLAMLCTSVSFLVANIGLSQLITVSQPILAVIYPVTIVLIALTLIHRGFKGEKAVYVGAIYLTLIVSLFNGLNAINLPMDWVNTHLAAILPLYSAGVGWLVPAIVGALGGYLFVRLRSHKVR